MNQRAALLNRLSLQPQRERVTTWFSKLSSSRAASLFLAFGLGVVVAGYFFTRDDLEIKTLVHEIYSNFGIELISIGLTVLVIDGLNRRRAEQERKEELISQMGSLSNDFALDAVRQLRKKGWLEDGSLQGAELRGANLQGADLENADLREVNLRYADLREMNLRYAKLHMAILLDANLQGADLGLANLQQAILIQAKLHGANMMVANLRGAVFTNDQLGSAKFDENTLLPDVTKWTPGRDLREFTHPEEWKAEQAAKGESDEKDV
jgi:hypothetical protein